MPTFRAEFDVKSALVLPRDAPPQSLRALDGQSEIVLRNGPLDENGHVALLDVLVIGESSDVNEASYDLRSLLVDQLDLLTYVTHARFEVRQCRRVVEWEPFQKSRTFVMLQTFDAHYPPSPDLFLACLKTANAISTGNPSASVRQAFHYFRMGVLARSSEDQFHQFWLTLETIAEGRKTPMRVPIPCPACNGPLMCEACGETPTTRPMANQAILDVITEIVRPEPDKVFRKLLRVRHHLVHGRSTESIEEELKQPLTDIVNDAAKAAWFAIQLGLPSLEGPITFGHMGGDFQYREIVAGPHGAFEHIGPDAHPSDDKIPTVTITLNTRFGPIAPPKEDGPH